MKATNFFKGIGALVIAFCLFTAGWLVGFNGHASLINTANAEPAPAPVAAPAPEPVSTPSPAPASVKYETIYASGQPFIVFTSSAGGIAIYPKTW